MPRVFVILKKSFFFVILFPFDILLHYPIINSSIWPKEDVQWITDKGFRETLMVLMASKLSFFSNEYLVFACICCFHNHKTYCDVPLITYD